MMNKAEKCFSKAWIGSKDISYRYVYKTTHMTDWTILTYRSQLSVITYVILCCIILYCILFLLFININTIILFYFASLTKTHFSNCIHHIFFARCNNNIIILYNIHEYDIPIHILVRVVGFRFGGFNQRFNAR